MKKKSSPIRAVVGILAVVGLVSVYLFQDAGFGAALLPLDPEWRFVTAKSSRFFLNDILAIGLIWALFPDRGYLLTALIVQLGGFIFFLIPYFVLKVGFGLGDGPLVSFLHRLVLNPTLLLLLIPAFYILIPRDKNDSRE